MFENFIFQLFAVMLAGFGGGDMLDMMSTDGYWKAKNITVTIDQLKDDAKSPPEIGDLAPLIKDLGSSEFKTRAAARKKLEALGAAALPQIEKAAADNKDDEAAETLSQLKTKLAGGAKARDVRRLMAIRTLGEKKEASAAPILEECLKSKDAFVADYAARALALIQGKPAPKIELIKSDKDVWLFPADLCIVGQLQPAQPLEKPIKIEAITESMMNRFATPDVAGGEDQKIQMQNRVYSSLLEFLESAGNVRLDSATIAVAGDVGPNSGWAGVICRGKCDRKAFVAAVASHGGTVDNDAGYPIVKFDRGSFCLFPTDDMLIFLTAPREEKMDNVVAGFKDALKNGKSPLADAPLAKDIKALQAASPQAWAWFKPNAAMIKDVSLLAPFGSMTLVAKTEPGKGVVSFMATAEVTDAEQVKESVKEMEDGLKEGIEFLGQHESEVEKKFAKILDTIKFEIKDGNVIATVPVSLDIAQILGLIMGRL